MSFGQGTYRAYHAMGADTVGPHVSLLELDKKIGVGAVARKQVLVVLARYIAERKPKGSQRIFGGTCEIHCRT